MAATVLSGTHMPLSIRRHLGCNIGSKAQCPWLHLKAQGDGNTVRLTSRALKFTRHYAVYGSMIETTCARPFCDTDALRSEARLHLQNIIGHSQLPENRSYPIWIQYVTNLVKHGQR